MKFNSFNGNAEIIASLVEEKVGLSPREVPKIADHESV
jgi:hypothetical protein